MLCVALLMGVAHQPSAAPDVGAFSVLRVEATERGTLELRFDTRQLDDLGLRIAGVNALDGVGHFDLLPRDGFEVETGDGAPTAIGSGALTLPGLRLQRRDGEQSPALRLVAAESGGLDLVAVDADGRVWWRLGHAMRSPDPREGLRLITAEIRIGAALAHWLQRPVSDSLLAGASLQLPLRWPKGSLPGGFDAFSKSCSAPNWPGVAGYAADVQLTNIDRIDVQPNRCRNTTTPASGCDGPGGDEGEVVIVPSATLRNGDTDATADVPWRTKFSGQFPPYNNDQHPFLVWNLYRADGDGSFTQIARSGVKHAFATANTGCSPEAVGCAFFGQILGRGCSDLYDASSNECATFLGPRSDLIPARGMWGRCGSIHDPDCDGVQTASSTGGFCGAPNSSPAGDGYSFRLAARESSIDPIANSGSRWFVDAWYIVRDDINIFNTMGYREIFPGFATGSWNVGAPSAFESGPVIDHWLELAPDGSERHRGDLATSEGNLGLAARVSQLPDGRYRYDYAVMNFDFSRAVTHPDSAEPNLRILRNMGVSALELDLANGAAVDSSSYQDGDATGSNDWPASPGPGAMRWSAPSGATLDWGRLAFVSVVSAAAPGNGEMRVEVAESGAPAFYTLAAPVPDAAQVFRDRFE